VYLKASDDRGRAVALLVLPYWHASAPDWSIFYSDWQLEVSGNGPVKQVFNSPTVPVRTEPYEDMQPTWRLLKTLNDYSPRGDVSNEDEEAEEDDED
jgi:hypothetical protein